MLLGSLQLTLDPGILPMAHAPPDQGQMATPPLCHALSHEDCMPSAANSDQHHPAHTKDPQAAFIGAGEDPGRIAAWFASIIAISADAIISIDQEQRITLFNQGAEAIFGYASEEVLGKPLDILLPEAVREIHRRHVREFGLSDTSARRMGDRGQIMGRRKGGELFPADASISQAVIAGEKVYSAVLRDITTAVHAQEALRQANTELQALIVAAPLAVVVLDAEGRVEIWNPAAERVLGWREEEVLGLAPTHIPMELREECRQLLERARSGAVATGLQTQLLRKDGARLAMRISVAPLCGPSGEIRGAIVILEDETSRRHADEVREYLAEAGRKLSSTLEYDEVLRTVAEVVVPWTADYCIIDLVGEDGRSHRPLAIHRDPARQELVERLRHFPAPHDQHPGTAQAIRTGKVLVIPEVTEAWLRSSAQGEEHYQILRQLGPSSVIIAPLQVRAEVIGAISCAYTDSGRHYREEDLPLAESLAGRAALAIDNAGLYRGLRQALRTRDEVLRIVAHDLRNPLNTISLSIGVLAESIPPELLRHCGPQLQIIRRAINRANRLIGDLLDVARMQAGHLSVQPHQVETVSLLEEALMLQRELAEEHNLQLERRFPASLPAIMADRDRVLQVFANLISNAIKFTPEGGRITVGAERVGAAIRFFISDTGPGVPADAIPHLFDAFWQAHIEGGEGTGLGLTICRGIVAAHGGRIWVESKLGAGSTFYFTIPLARATPPTSTPPISTPSPTVPPPAATP
jgi:PAS domain S-box-containing protein